MQQNGFILLHRSILKWEWYGDANTTRLFIHLLLSVNYTDAKWQGIEIKRGQRVASYSKLATELKLSVKQIRTALKHLLETGEAAHEATSKYSIITLLNYNKYQERASTEADEGQAKGNQTASKGQQYNNKNKYNKNNNKNKAQSAMKRKSSIDLDAFREKLRLKDRA